MPHIIIFIYDEEGNTIGEYHPAHDPEVDGLVAGEPTVAKMILYLDKIETLLKHKNQKH